MATANKKRSYTEDDLDALEGLDGIRAKPGMYIGTPNSDGIWTIVKEAADNTVDEYLSDRNDSCHIVYEGPAIWVIDNGEGMPVGAHVNKKTGEKSGKSWLTVLLTQTHAGGKLKKGGAYGASIGTHGIGIKASNALSSEFAVWTFRDGNWWHTSFAKGEEKSKPKKVDAPKLPFKLKTPKNGTVIRMVPDMSIFHKGSEFRIKDAHQWADTTSYINAAFRCLVTDKSGTKEYYHKDGPAEYIQQRIKKLGCETLGKNLYSINAKIGDYKKGALIDKLSDVEKTGILSLDIALAFTDAEGDQVVGYTNSSKNSDGGEHMKAMWAAFDDALSQFAPARAEYQSVDLREGVVGLLNVKCESPQFSSQTKEKLTDPRVTRPTRAVLYEVFYDFFSSNKSLAKAICQRASELRDMRNKMQGELKALRSLKIKKGSSTLPGKFAAAMKGCKPEDLEIYLVEGDSAGGSAKQARFREFQAVLPQKGKPKNAMKDSDAEVIASEQIKNVLQVIGYDPTLKNPLGNLAFGKLIFMADSDVDGYHISALNSTLIQKYLAPLFTMGMIYAVDSSKCKYAAKGKKQSYYFGPTPESIEKQVKANGDRLLSSISYLKGWGELNPEGVRIAAMDPKTRHLIRLTPASTSQAKEFQLLMGKEPDYRKKMMNVI